jgi:metallo-beta-lactamase class B
MLRTTLLVAALALAAACGSSPPYPAENAPLHTTWSEPVEPFRIVGDIYYVGARNIAAYLITTPAGHILLDTGTREMVPVVRASIERLGFALADVEILLLDHAHWDHVQGHAAIRGATGARVMVMRGDADAVRAGVDQSPLGDEGWDPVPVDRVLDDGDTVELGGTTLRAVHAPGHTPGCTVWTTRATEPDRGYEVVFYGCMRPNDGVRLIGNPRFPDLVDQTLATFATMRALHPDIYLLMHPEAQLAPVLRALRAGTRPHPLADPAAWPALLDEAEAEFRAMVAREQAAAPR